MHFQIQTFMIPYLILFSCYSVLQGCTQRINFTIEKKEILTYCVQKDLKAASDHNNYVKDNGVKNGLYPEYLDRIIPLHLTYEDPPDGNFFGFLKNAKELRYRKYYQNLRYVPKYATNQTKIFINNFKGKIAIYKDAYANEYGEFVINGHIIRPPFDTSMTDIRIYQNGPVVFECEKACVFGHFWMYNFGHFIHDYLSPLMLVPKDFLEECVVILTEEARKYGDDVLKAVGVR